LGEAGYRVRLSELGIARGAEARDLHVGAWAVRIEGLDRELADTLDDRWGPFLAVPGPDEPTTRLRVVDAGTQQWLPGPESRGELYRMEASGTPDLRVVVSYNFALGRDIESWPGWTLGITRGVSEPPGRILENGMRFVLAVLALDAGGFAMHSAGVLHDGRAFLYAGPSRSGKSTAVAASAPAESLGDDFGLVLPEGDHWVAPAVPFDGSERIAAGAPLGQYPVTAILRLYQASETSIDYPSAHVGVASLMSCTAFPWGYPERASDLLEHVRRFVEQCRFGHLRFALGSDLFTHVILGTGGAA
jgi:hypothetical protein